jgi:hypothetical protein
MPPCANDYKGFENEVTCVTKEIEKGDVQDLLQSHGKELDDLINLERELAYDAQIYDNDEQIDVAPKGFTLKKWSKCLELLKFLNKKS